MDTREIHFNKHYYNRTNHIPTVIHTSSKEKRKTWHNCSPLADERAELASHDEVTSGIPALKQSTHIERSNTVKHDQVEMGSSSGHTPMSWLVLCINHWLGHVWLPQPRGNKLCTWLNDKLLDFPYSYYEAVPQTRWTHTFLQ